MLKGHSRTLAHVTGRGTNNAPSGSPTSERSSIRIIRVGLVMDVPDMDAVMRAMETEAAADARGIAGAFVSTMAGPRAVVRRCGHSRDIPAHSRKPSTRHQE
jgi:hypothetical protein